jgi:hypothetical protein
VIVIAGDSFGRRGIRARTSIERAKTATVAALQRPL